jgi:hypothetical protein
MPLSRHRWSIDVVYRTADRVTGGATGTDAAAGTRMSAPPPLKSLGARSVQRVDSWARGTWRNPPLDNALIR